MSTYDATQIKADVATLQRVPRTQWVARCEAEMTRLLALAERVADAPTVYVTASDAMTREYFTEAMMLKRVALVLLDDAEGGR